MFSFFSDVAPLIEFLKTIQDGTIVLMATYDDGATKYVIDFKQQMLLKILHAVLYWKNHIITQPLWIRLCSSKMTDLKLYF